jgi:hypothetical protein
MVLNQRLDQWGLLAVVACCAVKITPEDWINGFIRVNLHPKHMRPIDVWLSEISEHLLASSRLKTHGKVHTQSLADLISLDHHFRR